MKKKFLMAALALCIAAGSADAGFGLTAEKEISFGGICEMLRQRCYTNCVNLIKPFCAEIITGAENLPGAGTADSEGLNGSDAPGTESAGGISGSGSVSESGSGAGSGSAGSAESIVSTVNSMEKQVASLTNSERNAAGLGNLTLDAQLSKLARLKAEDMAKNGYFSHTSPTYGSAFDMMKSYGVSYRTAGENIARGQKTAESVMNGWMNSSGHRANILGSGYTHIGVGYAEDSRGNTYWVQIFKG